MNEFKKAIKIFMLMTLLTGLLYPLLITAFAQLLMPKSANGSLIKAGNTTVGSLLIAQNTKENRYFWPRPSAIDYNPISPSGGSNLGPTSLKLKEAVQERKQKIAGEAPAELLYASGSGLDPHISLEAAFFQISRVAKERSLDEGILKKLIVSLSEGNQLGFLGKRYVNVLLLNQAIDEQK